MGVCVSGSHPGRNSPAIGKRRAGRSKGGWLFCPQRLFFDLMLEFIVTFADKAGSNEEANKLICALCAGKRASPAKPLRGFAGSILCNLMII